MNRRGANGDVLVATSVLPALKKKFPEAELSFSTSCTQILKGNPHVSQVYNVCPPKDVIEVIDLDLAYERTPLVQMMQAYADAAKVPYEDCEPFIDREEFPLLPDYVVFHVGKTNWVGRNWQIGKWSKVVELLREQGIRTVCVGSRNDFSVPCDEDLKGRTNIWQLADVIGKARMFVGIDSFPFNIAQTLNVPSVVFFGSILPQTRIFRGNVIPVSHEHLPCIGCHHYREAPVTCTNVCKNGDPICEKEINPEQIIEAMNIHISNESTIF